jgi:hypothetical protein
MGEFLVILSSGWPLWFTRNDNWMGEFLVME